VITDGVSGMTEKKIGLVGRIRQEMDRQNPIYYMEPHCIIPQQPL